MGRGAGDHRQQQPPRRAARRTGTRGPYRWTDATLRREHRAFTDGRTAFPRLIDLDASGRADLRAAVTELGGVEYWAARIGLPVAPRRRRTDYNNADVSLVDRETHSVASVEPRVRIAHLASICRNRRCVSITAADQIARDVRRTVRSPSQLVVRAPERRPRGLSTLRPARGRSALTRSESAGRVAAVSELSCCSHEVRIAQYRVIVISFSVGRRRSNGRAPDTPPSRSIRPAQVRYY